MLEFSPRTGRSFYVRARRTAMVTGIGLWVFLVQVSVAQQHGASLIDVPAPLRISVVSNVVQSCRGEIQPAALKRDAEERLRAAGITISNIYNGKLAADVDCVAVGPHSPDAAMAVHECLSFSRAVMPPTTEGRAMLATTWRECQSYTCGRGRCQPPALSRLGTLVGLFLADLKEQAGNELAISGTVPALQPSVRMNNAAEHSDAVLRPPTLSHVAVSGEIRPRFNVALIFYSLYIVTCLSVGLYWQLHRRPY